MRVAVLLAILGLLSSCEKSASIELSSSADHQFRELVVRWEGIAAEQLIVIDVRTNSFGGARWMVFEADLAGHLFCCRASGSGQQRLRLPVNEKDFGRYESAIVYAATRVEVTSYAPMDTKTVGPQTGSVWITHADVSDTFQLIPAEQWLSELASRWTGTLDIDLPETDGRRAWIYWRDVTALIQMEFAE